MTRKKRVLILLLCGSLVIVAISIAMIVRGNQSTLDHREAALDERAVKLVQALWLDDERSALLGNEAIVSKDAAMRNLGIAQSVSALKLSNDYAANEVAADQRYKPGRLLVSGTVREISKDFLNDPYVTLAGRGELEDVQAHFEERSENALARLHRGQSIDVVCEVSTMIVTDVMMKNCSLLDDYMDTKRSDVDRYILTVLEGRQPVSKSVAQGIAFLYVTAKLLPQDSSCFEKADGSCETQIESITKKADQSTRESLEKDANTLAATMDVK